MLITSLAHLSAVWNWMDELTEDEETVGFNGKRQMKLPQINNKRINNNSQSQVVQLKRPLKSILVSPQLKHKQRRCGCYRYPNKGCKE